MAKTSKNEIYTSMVKSKNSSTARTTLFTRIMAIFLAGLMLLGAISYAIFFLFGSSKRMNPAVCPDRIAITESTDTKLDYKSL